MAVSAGLQGAAPSGGLWAVLRELCLQAEEVAGLGAQGKQGSLRLVLTLEGACGAGTHATSTVLPCVLRVLYTLPCDVYCATCSALCHV